MKLCDEADLSIRITEGHRTNKRQQELYEQGRTTPGSIVTNAKAGQSIHNYRCAFDVVFINGGYNRSDKDWQSIGKLGKSVGLSWGGDWKEFKDRPHFDLTFGYSWQDFQQNRVDLTKYY